MTFKDSSHFNHAQPDKIGVLITNLGTPDAATPKALRAYLKEFLADPRVVEFPKLLWWIVLNVIILNIRPRRSAASYKKVWTDEGSPLAVYTAKQTDMLRERLQKSFGENLVVEWGMRYGNPSIDNALDNLLAQGARKLLVLPLYPQYSGSTSASTFDAVAKDFTQRRWIPELRFVTSYQDYIPYIEALATSIRQHWNDNGRAQKIIFSYHGIPKRYLHNGDPYHCQCHKTSRLLASALDLESGQYETTFQSRFGREPWLQPYTDDTMRKLPGKGVTSVQVVCPGFSSDCLETIEEIAIENREYFMEAGGEDFQYIPALNDRPEHIDALSQLIEKNLAGWLDDDGWTALRDSLYKDAKYNQRKVK
ncbi:MAG: ferrochelatase [Agarilytica sp.]